MGLAAWLKAPAAKLAQWRAQGGRCAVCAHRAAAPRSVMKISDTDARLVCRGCHPVLVGVRCGRVKHAVFQAQIEELLRG